MYLWGDVGRGKSMLMDLFFQTARVEKKRRVHFHAFMQEIHALLHARRQQEDEDPLPAVVETILKDCWLLCFDEFHVTNIVDAMLLQRLFTLLWDGGMVVVATSNWQPDDLYKDGLQRDAFLPFIPLLKQRLEVVALNGQRDYRQGRGESGTNDQWFAGADALQELEEFFAEAAEGDTGHNVILEHPDGRTITLPKASAAVAWLEFHAVCGQPLGVADYLLLAHHYPTICLAGVPLMDKDSNDAAKRFMLLIDTLYEADICLAVNAAAEPAALYRNGNLTFEFARTASRLQQMRFRGEK
jgi:cell division protein ZapE